MIWRVSKVLFLAWNGFVALPSVVSDFSPVTVDFSSRRLNASLPGTEYSISSENEEQAQELSTGIRDQMKSIRGGSDDFYDKLFKSFLITFCDQTVKSGGPKSPFIRHVPITDPTAYKDQNGSCINLLNPIETLTQSAYAENLCEVVPNCYWADFNITDSTRHKIYADPDSEITLAEAVDVLEAWGKGLMMFVVPGIALAVLTVLTMVLYCFCRCCCNKCGGRSAKPEGYSCCKKFIPILFFLLFSVGIAVTAGISLVYSNQFTSAISDVFDAAQVTIDNTSDWITNARQPLLSVNQTVFNVSRDIKVVLQGTDFIEDGIDGITQSLKDFNTTTDKASLPKGCDVDNTIGQICVPCDVCKSINEKVSQACDQMEEVSRDGINMLKDTRKVLIQSVADKSNETSTIISTNINPTYDLQNSLDDARIQVSDIQETYDAQDVYRMYGVLSLFVLSVIVIGIGAVGIFFGITPLRCLACVLHIGYMIGFFALFFSFILSSILIALSILLSDVCELSLIIEDDWGSVMGKQASTGLNACFNNVSLLSAYNLESSFEFTDQLNFNQELDIDKTLDFSTLEEFAKEINNTNSDTFDTSAMDGIEQFVTGFNELTKLNVLECTVNDNSYTTDNIFTPWVANNEDPPTPLLDTSNVDYIKTRYTPFDDKCYSFSPLGEPNSFKCQGSRIDCDYSALLVEMYTNITTLDEIQTQSVQFVDDMKDGMKKITNSTDIFKSSVVKLNNDLQGLVTKTVAAIIQHIADFKQAMTCTFVKTNYDNILDKTCNNLIPALTMIALCIFLMGIFLIPVNICMIILSKRLTASGNGEVLDQNEF